MEVVEGILKAMITRWRRTVSGRGVPGGAVANSRELAQQRTQQRQQQREQHQQHTGDDDEE